MLPLQDCTLLAPYYLFSFPVAQQGGFWSYIAGTVYRLIVAHEIPPGGGLEIDNHKTTLPMGKGLSSSAAVCVLVRVSLSGEGEGSASLMVIR